MPSISEDQSGCAIAIIGLSCRFPGDASGPSEFWELLKDGRSGYSPSTDRYNAKAFHHPAGNGARQNVIPTEGGYFIKQDPYVFDAAFFNITATEAMALDPRQRLAMEVAYEAVENAGLPLQRMVCHTETIPDLENVQTMVCRCSHRCITGRYSNGVLHGILDE